VQGFEQDNNAILKQDRDAEGWYLEGIAGKGKTWLIHLQPLPFMIGRQEDCHLCLSSPDVSRRHAEIYQHGGKLRVRECGSTNGTFINRKQLYDDAALCNGDVLHFGSLEFRVRDRRVAVTKSEAAAAGDGTMSVAIKTKELPHGFLDCAADFNEMLRQRAVTAYFQPIVRLSDLRTVGYELLGRGNFPGLSSSPGELMRIAQNLGKEIQLNELFRQVGVQQARGLRELLFINTVPGEMDLGLLQRSLAKVQQQTPLLALVLEVHETAITDLAVMRSLRAMLNEMAIKLAYDDFGAGQSRLLELIGVPPDYLKFDIGLIRNIHLQPSRFQHYVQTLVNMARDLEIQVLAEGVEVKETLQVCIQLGFDLAQGYYFGEPSPHLPIGS